MATAWKNYDNLSKQEKKRVVRTIKKAVHTRWLSLDTGIDQGVYGNDEALRIMKEDRAVGGAQADGFLRKVDNQHFWEQCIC